MNQWKKNNRNNRKKEMKKKEISIQIEISSETKIKKKIANDSFTMNQERINQIRYQIDFDGFFSSKNDKRIEWFCFDCSETKTEFNLRLDPRLLLLLVLRKIRTKKTMNALVSLWEDSRFDRKIIVWIVNEA